MSLVLALGILAAEFLPIAVLWFWIAAIAGLSGMIISTFARRVIHSREWIFVVLFNLFLFGLGGVLLRRQVIPERSDSRVAENTYVVEITSVPRLKNRFYQCDVDILFSSDSVENSIVGQKALLYISSDYNSKGLKINQRYVIRAKIAHPNHSGIPNSFDYGRFLRRSGYCGSAFVYPHDIEFLSEGDGGGLRIYAEKFRQRLVGRFRSIGIQEDRLSLLSAITLGEKSRLTKEVKSDFTDAGVAHVLVVSGMHVGFIYALILLCLRRVRRKVWVFAMTAVGLVVLWGYAILTGFAPSVVRAAFMFSLMLLFRVAGVQYRTESALFLSALLLLLFDPYLLFNVGFQLSYSAVLSIIFFIPYVSRCFIPLYNRYQWMQRLLLPLSVTIAAQVLTFPLVLFHFNQFPLYFAITNAFVSFLMPLIFILGMLALPLSFIPYLSLGCRCLLNHLLGFFHSFVAFVAHSPASVIHGYVSVTECILIYLLIAFIANALVQWKYMRYHFRSLVGVLVSALLLFITVFVNNLSDCRRSYCIVSSHRKLCVNLFSRSDNVLFVNSPNDVSQDLNRMWYRYKVPEPNVVSDTLLSANMFVFDGEDYLILRDNVFRYSRNTSSPLKVDCLIIDRGIYPSDRLFREFVLPQKVILTAGVYARYLPLYKALLSKYGIPYWSVQEQGAYVKVR